jgi:hypothetical protein
MRKVFRAEAAKIEACSHAGARRRRLDVLRSTERTD